MKPINKKMWIAVDADGERWLYSGEPEYVIYQWTTNEGECECWRLDKGHKLKRPEKSLKKVIVTIQEDTK